MGHVEGRVSSIPMKETESVRAKGKVAQPAVFLDRDGTINVEKIISTVLKTGNGFRVR